MMNLRTDRLRDEPTLGQKKIFAVELRPLIVGGKAIQHIVIFDNHPASIRLLLSSDLTQGRRNEFFYAVLAIASVLVAGLGIFWSLL